MTDYERRASEAHNREAAMTFEAFRAEFDNYEGLSTAQRDFGDTGMDAAHNNYATPVPRDSTYYDTQYRGAGSAHSEYDPTNADWYPEVEAIGATAVDGFAEAA